MTDELEEVFLGEKELYLKLLSAAERKKTLIIDNDAEALRELIGEETELIAKAGELEKKRTSISRDLAKRFGIEEESFRLSEISEKLGETAARDRLMRARDELSGILQSLAELNNTNTGLLEQRREYATVMLGAILGGGQPCDVYDRTGSAEKVRQWSGLIDKQV